MYPLPLIVYLELRQQVEMNELTSLHCKLIINNCCFFCHDLGTVVIAGNIFELLTDGTGTLASFFNPLGICINENGDILVADQGNNAIRRISISDMVVSTIAGSSIAGHADGSGTNAQFSFPTGITFDLEDNVMVVDSQNHKIRIISPIGRTTLFVLLSITALELEKLDLNSLLEHPF